MFSKLSKLDPVIHVFLFIFIVILSAFSLYLYNEVRLLSAKQAASQLIQQTEVQEEKLDESKLKQLISDTVSELLPSPTTTVKVVNTTTQTNTTPRTSYIPMGSQTTTTSTDWVDVPDSEVYIDLKNDFGTNAYVTFEANLKVAHGNGQTYVRLYDATNKITVEGSELSTIDNADYKQVSSSKLNLWQGRNLYKVQMKSLNSFEVTYSGGKIKVAY